MFRTALQSLFSKPINRTFCSTVLNTVREPVIIPPPKDSLTRFQSPREVWIENVNTIEPQKLGIIALHPDVFAAAPRIDVIHQNVVWQQKYRHVRFAHTKTRGEVQGGGRKPWPQKGLGKARAGSIRSPLFRGGGRAHGPRSPTTHFFMLPFYKRVMGLTSTLSVKLAQDDLHIIDNLDIPTEDFKFIESLIEERKWGPSVLFVDVNDIVPENIALATEHFGHINIMPAYSLNVYSMLKHDTLVLTVPAVEHIQNRLLYQLKRNHTKHLESKYKADQH